MLKISFRQLLEYSVYNAPVDHFRVEIDFGLVQTLVGKTRPGQWVITWRLA